MTSAGWWSAERKARVGFAVALVCLTIVAVMSYLSVVRLSREAGWVDHTFQVLDRLDVLMSSVGDAQIGTRRYVTAGGVEDLERYRRNARAASEAQSQLATLVADNLAQTQRLQAIAAVAKSRFALLDSAVGVRQTQGAEAARLLDPSAGQELFDQFHREVIEMKSVEEGLLHARQLRTRQAAIVSEVVIASGGALAIAVAALALIAVRRELAGRTRAEHALRAAKGELETRVVERTAELVLANDQSQRNEQRFRAFISATSDVIYRMSADWSEMYHLQGKDFIADTSDPSRSWLEKYIHPDDQGHVMATIQAAIGGRHTFELEHRVRRVDGSFGWTFSRAIPMAGETGEVVEWFGAAGDVTERKEAEIKLQDQLLRLNLLQQITRAIGARQDLRSILLIVTDSLEQHLSIDFACVALCEDGGDALEIACVGPKSRPQAASLGLAEQTRIQVESNGFARSKSGLFVYEPDVADLAYPATERLAHSGLRALVLAPLSVESTVFGLLIAARRGPGSFSSADCEFLQQLSEHLAIASHQVQLYTSLQRAYEDLRQTQEAMVQHERLRALGQLASGVAHDINNALSPPAIYVQLLLRDESIASEAREHLKVIQRSIGDIAATVARLRMFSRGRTAERARTSVDLNQLLLQVSDVTKARWRDMPQEHGIVIDLHTEFDPALPPITGTENEIRDALLNLVLNATDAMPRGGRLTLRSRGCKANAVLDAAPSGPVRICIEVIDTGIGMTEEVRRRCLDPFFTTKGERGTGLGLAMVYGMAQHHDALLEIDSEAGAGTTVRILFPVATTEATAPQPIIERSVGRLRVLLIDDDAIVLRAIELMLESEGHSVTTADSGQGGIDAFFGARERGEPFSAVFTDLGMPNVDGRNVAAAIKSVAPKVPVIMLTGWGHRMRSEGDLPEHVDVVLSKPPKVTEIRAALAELV